jgi:hypothetical protein
VVVEVAESVADSAGPFDEQVDRFGGSVGGAVGVEVGQQFGPPGVEGAAEAGDLTDRGRARVERLLQSLPTWHVLTDRVRIWHRGHRRRTHGPGDGHGRSDRRRSRV